MTYGAIKMATDDDWRACFEVLDLGLPSMALEPVEVEPGPPRNPVVYFVRCGDFIKIGRTDCLPLRLKDMGTVNPYPLTVIHTVPGNRRTEIEFHTTFAAHRHRGEWFRLEGALEEFLACFL